jgi:hypothetical protein
MGRRNKVQGNVAPSGTKVLYPIHDGPQMEFMTTDAEEVLYGGAASGGKSHALRALGVSYCLSHPGAVVVLFRRTFRELEDTHILRLQQELPTYIATYKASTHDFIFPNGSILMMRFCEKEEDVRSYDTFEADMMLFDELTAFSEFQYVYLTTRCRSVKPWWKGPKIMAATNPGNVGHLWVKKRWIDFAKPYEKKVAPVLQGGMLRQFIPAKVADNPTLMKRDPGYVNRLQGLPEEEKRAKLFGDWNVFSGQFFQRWRDDVHLCDDFTPPAEWLRYIFVDWGLAVPHAVLWATRPPGTNFLWIYREQYGANVPTREQARLAAQKTRASGEKIEYIIGDPAMWAKEKDIDGNLLASVADVWKTEFNSVCEMVRGNNERVMGWAVVRECLDWQGIETPSGGIQLVVPPRIRIMRDACPNLSRTLPALVHSKNNPEDVNTDSEDHAPDALRYGVRHIFGAVDKASKVRYIDTPTGIVMVGV